MIARALLKGGITLKAFDKACLLWAFGTLINNTDMHSGNLSNLSEGRRPYELAPAYDMAPMAFARTAGEGLPDRPLELTVGEQVSAAVWKEALAIAQALFVGWRTRKHSARGSMSARPCWYAIAFGN